MRLTLRQLEVFAAVAAGESVSRAAAALPLSQSAASAALAELERAFDVQLFDRVGKRLRLNDLGRALLPGATELLDRARELEAALGEQSLPGELRVGATLTIGNYVGAPLVGEYLRRHPGRKLALSIDNTAAIIARVADFSLDLGLVEGRCQDPAIEVTHWADDALVVFAAPSHPLANKRRVTPADLDAATWVLREPGSGTRDTFERAVAGVIADLKVGLELDQTEAIKQAVASGLGLGCISRLALREEFTRGTLVALKTPFLDMRREFSILVHRKKYRTAACREFIALCREAPDPGAKI
jgi:DNA-binding transcriptional LysR family regulator